MKLAVLWSRLSGHLSTCLKTFVDRYNAELLVVVQPADRNAPYSREEFEWIKRYVIYEDKSDFQFLYRTVLEFGPDAILYILMEFPGL